MSQRTFFAADENATAQRWAVAETADGFILAVAKDSLYCVKLSKDAARERFAILRTEQGKPVKINKSGCADVERRVSRFYGM